MLTYHKQIDKRTTMKNQNRSAALGRPAMKLLGGSHKTVSLDSSLDSDVHSAKDIDKILSSKRTNGKLYYHGQWKAKEKANTWESAQSVPSVLVKEMHISRTMSGRNKRHKAAKS